MRFLSLPTAFLCASLLAAGCNVKSSKTEESSSSATTGYAAGSSTTTAAAYASDPVTKVRITAARTQSMNNLKQIGLAMHNYSDTNGRLPTVAICDAQGNPLLSWRVAILPFVEQQNLYQQFKLNEPWDSEHNKKLIPMMPKTYRLPNPDPAAKQLEGVTHYRVFASRPSEARELGALFDWPEPGISGAPRALKIFEIPDGTSQTLLAVEAEEGEIWTKPEALMYHPKKPVPKLGSAWNGVGNVLLVDGSVRAISRSISESTLRALITRSANDIPGNDF